MSEAFKRIEALAYGTGTDTRHPETPCFACKAPLSVGTGLAGHVPSEGDLSVCAYCGAFAVFTEGLNMRPLSEAEFLTLPADIRQQLEEGRDLLRAARLGRDVPRRRTGAGGLQDEEGAVSECQHLRQHHGVCVDCGEEPEDTISLAQFDEAVAEEQAKVTAAENRINLAIAELEPALMNGVRHAVDPHDAIERALSLLKGEP